MVDILIMSTKDDLVKILDIIQIKLYGTSSKLIRI